MNILVIPNIPFSYMKGGLETQLNRTIHHLKAMGVQVKILNFEDETLLKWADLVHVFGIYNIHLAEGAAVRKPTVISSVFYQQSAVKRIYLKTLGYLPKTEPANVKRLLRLAHRILPNSESEKKQLINLFGVPDEQCNVVVNGLDISARGDGEAFRQAFLPDLAIDQRIVFSAHRVEVRKNSLALIEACGSKGIPLVIAGALGEGAQAGYAKQAMEMIQRYPSVRYIGPLAFQDLVNGYAFAHVHALPSFMETPGLSSLEAGAQGCNLVVGTCPPVHDYFGGIAWIVRHDAKSIQKGIAQALESDRDNFQQSQVIADKFTWKRAAEMTFKVYEEVLATQ
ncbi:MAG: glycosyltransferase family 4 protein [Oligoflexus sp.]